MMAKPGHRGFQGLTGLICRSRRHLQRRAARQPREGPTPDHSRDLGAVEQDGAFEAIVSRLRVVIEPDGSVRVDGVPADLPEPQQRDLATEAARAAVGQLEQIARHGRPITSAQRRAATKAAKAAARDWLTVGYLATA